MEKMNAKHSSVALLCTAAAFASSSVAYLVTPDTPHSVAGAFTSLVFLVAPTACIVSHVAPTPLHGAVVLAATALGVPSAGMWLVKCFWSWTVEERAHSFLKTNDVMHYDMLAMVNAALACTLLSIYHATKRASVWWLASLGFASMHTAGGVLEGRIYHDKLILIVCGTMIVPSLCFSKRGPMTRYLSTALYLCICIVVHVLKIQSGDFRPNFGDVVGGYWHGAIVYGICTILCWDLPSVPLSRGAHLALAALPCHAIYTCVDRGSLGNSFHCALAAILHMCAFVCINGAVPALVHHNDRVGPVELQVTTSLSRM